MVGKILKQSWAITLSTFKTKKLHFSTKKKAWRKKPSLLNNILLYL